jgi:hypothetical protein
MADMTQDYSREMNAAVLLRANVKRSRTEVHPFHITRLHLPSFFFLQPPTLNEHSLSPIAAGLFQTREESILSSGKCRDSHDGIHDKMNRAQLALNEMFLHRSMFINHDATMNS